jgi:hypothetical protein
MNMQTTELYKRIRAEIETISLIDTHEHLMSEKARLSQKIDLVEGAYAHAALARRNVAKVLAEKVEAGYLTEDEAMALAHRLLRENAVRFFRLPV